MAAGSLSSSDATRLSAFGYGVQCVLDSAGAVLRASDQSLRLLGFDGGATGTLSITGLIHPDDVDRWKASLEAAVTDAVPDFTARCRRPDGKYRIIEWRLAPGDDGEIYACARDVTEREHEARSADALRILEDEAERVARLGSWRLGVPVGDLVWSPQMYRIFGVDPADRDLDLATVTQTAIHPDDRDRIAEINRQVLEDGVPRPAEYRILRPDGEVRWVDARGRQVTDGTGAVVALTGFVQDITERKLDEIAATEREVRLQAVIDNAPFGAHMYRLEDADRLVFIGYNQMAVTMLGLDHEALLGLSLEEAFPGNIGTETPDRYRDVARTGIPWEQNQYAYDAEGIAGVFEVYAFSFGPNKVSVFFRDITDQKRSEARILESEAHFRAAFEQAAVGMIETASDGTFTAVNDRICEMLGYAREELEGRTFQSITYVDDLPEDLSALDRLLGGTADRHSAEKRYVRKDGSLLWVDLSITPVKRPDGSVRYFLGAVRDISAQKAAEDAVIEREHRLEVMVREVAEAMGRVAEARDPYTQDHEVRVDGLAHQLGLEMGLAQDDLDALELACLLHDVGKLHVPVEILTKPGRLSATEFALIKEHPQEGYDILKGIDFPWPIAEIVLEHHERMDGSGYPRGLAGEQILRMARVLSVADVVEAMATNRPYRPALGLDAAMAELNDAPEKYDGEVVAACKRLFEAGRIAL